jgi:hypothetical protein
MREWLLADLRDDVNRLLLDKSRRGLVDRDAASSVWRRVLAHSPGAAHTAYAILVAELWFEESMTSVTSPPLRARQPFAPPSGPE